MSIYMVYPGSSCHLALYYWRSLLSCQEYYYFQAAQAFQKYAWRVSLRRIHVLGVVEWSCIPLQFRCNFAGVVGKVGGPNCHNIKLWLICWRDRRLSPLLQHEISLPISYFLTRIQSIFLRFGAHLSLDIFTKTFYTPTWCT